METKNALRAAEDLVKICKQTGAASMTMLIKNLETGATLACIVVAVQPESAELLNEFGDMLTERRTS
jgi:hypothetical protein